MGLKVMGRCEGMEERADDCKCSKELSTQHRDFHVTEREKLNPYLWLSDNAKEASWRFHWGIPVTNPKLVSKSPEKPRAGYFPCDLESRECLATNRALQAAVNSSVGVAGNTYTSDRAEHLKAAAAVNEAARVEHRDRAIVSEQRDKQEIVRDDRISTESSFVPSASERRASLRDLRNRGDSFEQDCPSAWMERCSRYPELYKDLLPSMTSSSYLEKLSTLEASDVLSPPNSRRTAEPERDALHFCKYPDSFIHKDAGCSKPRTQSDSGEVAVDTPGGAEARRCDISNHCGGKEFDSKSRAEQFEKMKESEESPATGSISSTTSSTVQSISTKTIKSSSTSSLEVGLRSSSGCHGHQKFKKYLHNRWLESNPSPTSGKSVQATSPQLDDLGKASMDSVDTEEIFPESRDSSSSIQSASVTAQSSRPLEGQGRDQLLVHPSVGMRSARKQDWIPCVPRLRRLSQDTEPLRVGESAHHGMVTDFENKTRTTQGQNERTREKTNKCISSVEESAIKYPEYSGYHSVLSSKGSEIFFPFSMIDPALMIPALTISPFHPVRPCKRSHSGSTPPSQMVPSHKGIRRYNSLGSSVSPSSLVSDLKEEPGSNLNTSHGGPRLKEEYTLTLEDRSHSSIVNADYSWKSRVLQRSISPVPLQPERSHVSSAQRILSLGTPGVDDFPHRLATAPVSPADRRSSPAFPSRLSPHRNIHRVFSSPPFYWRARDTSRISPVFDQAFPDSSRSSPPWTSTVLPSFVCPVCGDSMKSYQSLSHHLAVHVAQSSTLEFTGRAGSLSILELSPTSVRSQSFRKFSLESPDSEGRSFGKSLSEEKVGGGSAESAGMGMNPQRSVNQEDSAVVSETAAGLTHPPGKPVCQEGGGGVIGGVGGARGVVGAATGVEGGATGVVRGATGVVVGATGGVQSSQHLCKVCNKRFSRSDMLSRHMRLHTGHRPYECELCGQVFSRSDHLHTHQRTHTGEKPYHCKFCAYAAPRKDMVTRHMRVHTRDNASGRGRRCHTSTLQRQAPPTRERIAKSRTAGVTTRTDYRSAGLISESDYVVKNRVQPSSMTSANCRSSSFQTFPHDISPDSSTRLIEKDVNSLEMSIKSEEAGPHSPDLSIKSELGKIPLERHHPSLSIKPDLELIYIQRNISKLIGQSEVEVTPSRRPFLNEVTSSRRPFLNLSVPQDVRGISSPSSSSSNRSNSRSRLWSRASGSTSSYRGSPPYPPSSRDSTSSRTLSEISEMFPSPGYAGPTPSFWSPCTDSPGEVFTPSVKHQIRHFIWPSVAVTSAESSELNRASDL